jgi:hypothetical protein
MRLLHGGYALTRMGKGKTSRWLLVKKADDEANARVDVLRAAPASVLSGLTIEQIAASVPSRKRAHPELPAATGHIKRRTRNAAA